MASAMRVEVEGEDITQEEVSEKFGWRVAGEKKTQEQESKLSLTPLNGGPAAAGHRRPQRKNFKSKLLKAARMPELPRQDIKIVMRPRGGPNLGEVSRFEIRRAIIAAANVSGEEVTQDVICPNKQQNIVVTSTPNRENADRYSAVRNLTISGTAHDVSAYETAPHGTVKGVIRGVPMTDTIQEINDYIVQDYNPTALQANRIGKTTTVVIAFDGDKVPNYIRYGNLLVECSLYRKQIDMCYLCGHLGHRMDVCPNPEDKICRGSGMKNPEESHVCTNPKCSLCGGNHLTADKECKARFKTPYVVRKRRWERQQREEVQQQQQQQPRGPAWQAPDGRRSRSQTRRGRSKSDTSSPAAAGARRRESRSRSKSKTRRSNGAEKQVGWAAGSPFSLDNSNFPPLRSSHPSKDNECRHCLELKQMIERQNNQIKSQNDQNQAMMERIETLSRTTKSDNDVSVLKRKVPKRDTTSAAPAATKPTTPPALTQSVTKAPPTETAAVAMEEETVEAAVPPTMESVMSMLTEISCHVSQMSAQVNSLTVRMDNVEAKCSQLSVRVMTLDAKNKHLTVAKMKSPRLNLRVMPRKVGSVRNSSAQKVQNDED
ncbi:hypothetical protein V5799_027237 [Amblyomma americanum]|uniref:CCHC-type domain-containing protein n=1 Tax=Amblyomma americanum TaxID=6943 RepID=A0AAQ4DGA7_AMBAM